MQIFPMSGMLATMFRHGPSDHIQWFCYGAKKEYQGAVVRQFARTFRPHTFQIFAD